MLESQTICAALPWIKPAGEKPDVAGYIFVYARYEGETREEAEACHDGYGQSVDSVEWQKVVEYRRKRHPVSL